MHLAARQQAERIMDRGQSRCYQHAIAWLKRSRAAALGAGRQETGGGTSTALWCDARANMHWFHSSNTFARSATSFNARPTTRGQRQKHLRESHEGTFWRAKQANA